MDAQTRSSIPTSVGKTWRTVDYEAHVTLHPHIRGKDAAFLLDFFVFAPPSPHPWERRATAFVAEPCHPSIPTSVERTGEVVGVTAARVTLPPHIRGKDGGMPDMRT